MQKTYLIKKAVLSEKTYKLMESGIYTFLVDPRAKKDQIAKTIEGQFGVKVKKVNVSSFAPKRKRIPKSRQTSLVGGGKKALVYLEAGQSIPLISPKTESKKTSKKDKDAKKVEAKVKTNEF